MVKRYKQKNVFGVEIPSKIYLLCYTAPRTQKQLAKITYGDIRRQSYISRAINNFKMVEDGFLVHEKDVGYISNPRPLFEQFLNDLKQKLPSGEKQPTTKEQKQLLNFLDNEFRDIVKNYTHLIEEYSPYIILRDFLGRTASMYVEFRKAGIDETTLPNTEFKVMERLPYNLVEKLQYLIPKTFRVDDELIASLIVRSYKIANVVKEQHKKIDSISSEQFPMLVEVLNQTHRIVSVLTPMDSDVIDLMVKKYEEDLERPDKNDERMKQREKVVEAYRASLGDMPKILSEVEEGLEKLRKEGEKTLKKTRNLAKSQKE